MKNMKTSHATVVAILACLAASSVSAVMCGVNSLDIDFTNSTDAKAKATWSTPDRVTISTSGLGLNRRMPSCCDGWIQTIPLAIGLSWRPAQAISVRISIYPKPVELVYHNGNTRTIEAGNVYVRYSPDAKHWSTWQVLQSSEPQSDPEKQNPGRHFRGSIQVPNVERDEYEKLIADYAKLDVPWRSDEDAAVRWILKTQPEFFAKHLPFIGYVEFRFESDFYGGLPITSFKAEAMYGIGGLSSPPKDMDSCQDRNSFPWSFKADDKGQNAEPSIGGAETPALQP